MTERKNLVASILARLKNIAKENDVVCGEILARYAIERVLKRIELSEYASKCILKGGSLFILWTEGFNYRPTMDADLEFRGDGSPTALKAMFKSIAKLPLMTVFRLMMKVSMLLKSGKMTSTVAFASR